MARYIRTENAPTPGPYSQAVVIDPALYNLVLLAGQTANVPGAADEAIIDGGFGPQTMQTLQNILAVVEAAGGDASHIVEVTVFLQDSEDSGVAGKMARNRAKKSVDTAYKRFFRKYGRTSRADNLPCRTLVWVAELPLVTENTLVEIRATAAVPKAK